MKQGDLVAFQTRGIYAVLIRFGQRVFGKMSRESALYTHIAYVDEVLPDGDAWLFQAVRTIDRVKLSEAYPHTPFLVLPFPGTVAGRKAMRPFASGCLGMRYGLVSVVSRGINYVTPRWLQVDFTRDGRMDCSGYGSRIWEHGGVTLPNNVDPFRVTPGNEVEWYGPKDARPSTFAA